MDCHVRNFEAGLAYHRNFGRLYSLHPPCRIPAALLHSSFAISCKPVSNISRRSTSQACRASVDKVDRRAVDKSKILKEDPYGTIEDVMSENVVCVQAEDSLESILEYLEKYTGLPVVDGDGKCVGVISDKDIVRFIKHQNPATDEEAEAILQNKIGDCMTKPAITIRKKAAIAFAAGLMLNHKVHRLPVVDKNQKVIGIVTRQDIYEPLMPGVNPLYKRRDMDETTLAEWHDLGDY